MKYTYGGKLDLTKSTKLKYLTCEGGDYHVDISNCTALEELTWISNHSVDISNNRALKYLYYSNGDNNDLDISNNTALETIHFLNSDGKILSFKNNSSLKNVYIHMKDGEKYDFSNNFLLENLTLWGGINNGKFYSVEFDIKNCVNLTIGNCDLDIFDIRQCSLLKTVLISGCDNLSLINAAKLQNLVSFRVTSSYFPKPIEADFSNCINLQQLELPNVIRSLNLTGCTSLEGWPDYPR
jgi:hypothetical protein